jgi:hypothetical protein
MREEASIRLATALAGMLARDSVGRCVEHKVRPMQEGWSAADWNALASWLTFGVLLVSLVFVRRQVKEAIRLREAQKRPFVVVDFDVEGVLLT